MDFYERTKTLVKTKTSLTLRAFIESIGINYDTYKGQSRYNNLPRANEAVAIATALNTTVEYLVTGIPPTQNKTFQEVRVLLEKTLSLLPPNF